MSEYLKTVYIQVFRIERGDRDHPDQSSHFTDEGTKNQKDKVTCSRSLSCLAEPGFLVPKPDF